MKKLGLLFVGAALLILTGFSAQSDAGVDIGIGINIPAYEFAEPPSLVVIPGSYVYFVPDVDLDVLFYHGFWYRPHEGRWFRSRAYNGPWGFVAHSRVPGALIELPREYRHIPPGHRHIPYKEFNKNWKRWEKNKHWEKDEHWRQGRHEERRDEKREERREERREEHHRGR
jgi:hypothetical protein